MKSKMKNIPHTFKRTLCTLFCAAMLLGTACGSEKGVQTRVAGGENENNTYKVLKAGDTAPDFTVELADGSSFTLSEHSEETIFLNFWATWCPPCVGELPDLEKIAGEGLENFSLVAVNVMEDKETVDAFIKKYGYTMNIGYDEDGTIGIKYPTDGIPYSLVIKKGVIKKIYLGAPRDAYNEYKKTIEENLDK